MKFQITGLPRSGTAWLSAAMNLCPDIMCVHESVDNGVHIPSDKYSNTGDSGSHLLIPEYRDRESDLRIFIHRDAKDSYDSLCSVTKTNVPAEWWNGELMPLALDYFNRADLVLDFKSLFTIESVEIAWRKISDSYFESDKVAMMTGMNVQRDSLEYDFNEDFMKAVRDMQNNERRVA